MPSRVLFFDQEDLFGAVPALQLLFAGNSVADVLKWFEIDEFCGVVGLAEAGDCFGFMLGSATEEIVGHADVKNAGLAGHDIDVINHGGIFT